MSELKMPEGTHLAYTIYHETQWWKALCRHDRPNEGRRCVQVAASAKGESGGVEWEFGIVEYDLRPTALRIEMFDEAWEAFAQVAPLFAAMAEGRARTLDDVVVVLGKLGAVDETDR